MSIELKIAKEEDRELWDELVERSPHGTIFHIWKFLKIMEKHSRMRILGRDYRPKFYPIIGLMGDTPFAVYPLFHYNSFFIKYVFSPALGTEINYQGPLIVNYDNLKQSKRDSLFVKLQNKVDDFVRSKLRANIIKIRSPPHFIDTRPMIWNGYNVRPLYNYEIDLNEGLERIWKSFNKDLRKNVNKTKASDLIVSEGSKKELEFIIKSINKRYSSQGINHRINDNYVLDIYQTFYPKNIKIFVVKEGNKTISGNIVLIYRKKVYVWIGMPKTDINGLYPNDFLQWECIKWAHNQGYSVYEITWANTYRLCRYKSKYNPKLSLYFSCEKYSSIASFFHSIKSKINLKENSI